MRITSPVYAPLCIVHVKNIRDYFCKLSSIYVDNISRDPDVCEFLDYDGVTGEERNNVWKAMANATTNMDSIEKIIQKIIHAVAVHEVGHACGVPGHRITVSEAGDAGVVRRQESGIGDLHCPMRYWAEGFDVEGIILVNYFLDEALPLLQANRFCTTGFNCYSWLNVNDSA